MPLFIAQPDNDSKLPGLILIHEIFGLTRHIEDVCKRFAAQNLRVYAPDLFAGAAGLPDDRSDLAAMRAVWQSIPDSQLIDDLKVVLVQALANPGIRTNEVGTIGYCMGGAIAYMFACSAPEIAFVIDYYGRIEYPQLSDTKPRHPIDYSHGLKGPVLGLFSGMDELIPRQHVEQLQKRLLDLGKSCQVKVYADAPHAFFNDTRPNYNQEAATDAWRLTLDFIARHTS